MQKLEYILDGVCETLKVSKHDVLSRKRQQHIIDARVIYTAIAISNTNETLTAIGRHINRDHAMAIHYRSKHAMYVETDRRYKNKYDLCLYVAASIPTDRDERCIIDRLMRRNSILSERYRYEKSRREELEHKLRFIKANMNVAE